MHITRESGLNINGENGKRAENDYKLREKQWTDRKSKKRKKWTHRSMGLQMEVAVNRMGLDPLGSLASCALEWDTH